MNKYIAILFLVFSGSAFAESYFCAAEKGAGIVEWESGNTEAQIFDVSSQKYILTDSNGSWVVKHFGMDIILFDRCTAGFHCDRSGEDFAGFFSFIKSRGTFTAYGINGPRNSNESQDFYYFVAIGRCSKI